MGICKSCCRLLGGVSSNSEVELADKNSSTSDANSSSSRVTMTQSMSAPTIDINNDTEVSGSGLALSGVNVEQDAAYWEWHVEFDNADDNGEGDEGKELDDDAEIKFGVATKKTQEFYRALMANDDGEDVPMEDDGTALMKSIPNLRGGDVIGVALQHSDLPMIQFLHNGEPLHHLAINRFRGMVFPSVWLRGCEGLTVKAVFKEFDFKGHPPHHRFGPLIKARGII